MPVAHFVRRSLLFLTSGVLLLTGCGADASAPPASAPGDSPGDSPGEGNGFPLTLDNCGRTVEVTAPPRQAVSLNQGSTEILLALGLADRIAGTASWTDPLPEALAGAGASVPRLAENAPSFERVLDAGPDFVAASFASSLGPGGVATREQFEELGVPTYLSPADCVGKDNSGDGDGVRTESFTLETVYGEVRDLARVFGAEERGEELVAGLEARVAEATSGIDASGVSFLYWFANSEAPYMAGCCGAPGVITGELGADNVFDDTREEWPQINWETVADRDPDVLVLGDLTRDSQTAESAAEKIAFLESHPVTRNMTAVREQRYVPLSGQALNPGIRTVEGLEQVAAALRAHGFVE